MFTYQGYGADFILRNGRTQRVYWDEECNKLLQAGYDLIPLTWQYGVLKFECAGINTFNGTVSKLRNIRSVLFAVLKPQLWKSNVAAKMIECNTSIYL